MEAFIPKPTFPWGKLKPSEDVQHVLFVALGSIVFFFGIIMLAHYIYTRRSPGYYNAFYGFHGDQYDRAS